MRVFAALILMATAVGPPAPEAALSAHAAPGQVSVAFTGDTLIHPAVSRSAARNGPSYDFRPMFADVRRYLATADLAICHLEVPLSEDNSGLSGYPLFNAPREVADALAYAGYDGCSTASNHSYDRRGDGVAETIGVLAEAGLNQAGMSVTPDGGWDAAYYEVGDLTLAHISATYWLNGLRMPQDQQWLVQLLDTDQMLTIAARARRMGADIVVVSVHCCVEYRSEPTVAQREMTRALVSSPDVDLVVGHHSHVVGPIENVDGEFIVHGLGNFLSAQSQSASLRDGVIAIANVEWDSERWAITGIDVVPTWVQPGTYRVLVAEHANPGSYRRTLATLTSWGAAGVGEPEWSVHDGLEID